MASPVSRKAWHGVRLCPPFSSNPSRILPILERLLQRSKWNIKSLAADLELSERTIHRYLNVLEIAGVPFYYDKAEKCYRVRPGYTFPVLNLTPDELLGQAAATVVAEATGLDAGAATSPAKPETEWLFLRADRSRQAPTERLSQRQRIIYRKWY